MERCIETSSTLVRSTYSSFTLLKSNILSFTVPFFQRYELYSDKDEEGYEGHQELPAKYFPDFANEGPITWSSFCKGLVVTVFPLNVLIFSNRCPCSLTPPFVLR